MTVEWWVFSSLQFKCELSTPLDVCQKLNSKSKSSWWPREISCCVLSVKNFPTLSCYVTFHSVKTKAKMFFLEICSRSPLSLLSIFNYDAPTYTQHSCFTTITFLSINNEPLHSLSLSCIFRRSTWAVLTAPTDLHAREHLKRLVRSPPAVRVPVQRHRQSRQTVSSTMTWTRCTATRRWHRRAAIIRISRAMVRPSADVRWNMLCIARIMLVRRATIISRQHSAHRSICDDWRSFSLQRVLIWRWKTVKFWSWRGKWSSCDCSKLRLVRPTNVQSRATATPSQLFVRTQRMIWTRQHRRLHRQWSIWSMRASSSRVRDILALSIAHPSIRRSTSCAIRKWRARSLTQDTLMTSPRRRFTRRRIMQVHRSGELSVVIC